MKQKLFVSFMTLLMLIGIAPQAIADGVDLSKFYTYTDDSETTGGYKVGLTDGFKTALNANTDYAGWTAGSALPNPAPAGKYSDGTKEMEVTNMSEMFSGCTALPKLDLSKFDTENVKNMSSMFNGCTALRMLDLTNFKTDKVETMSSMFYGCATLTALDLTNFNTSAVTNMSNMFSGCTAMMSVDISSFVFNEGVDTAGMFDLCGSQVKKNISAKEQRCVCWVNVAGNEYLKDNTTAGNNGQLRLITFTKDAISVSGTRNDEPRFYKYNIITAKPGIKQVTLHATFQAALKNGTSFTVAYKKYADANDNVGETVYEYKWEPGDPLPNPACGGKYDSEPVAVMKSLFGDNNISNNNIQSLDLSAFNTVNVTDMYCMFSVCKKLTTLTLGGNFDTSKVTDMTGMFNSCSALTSLDLTKFDTSNVTNMSYLFSGCGNLASLDLSNFDTSNVTTMKKMFYNCENLTLLDLSNFDTSNVTNMSSMFTGCGKTDSSTIPTIGLTKDENTANNLNNQTGDSPNIIFGVKHSDGNLNYALFNGETKTATVLPKADGYSGNIDIPVSVDGYTIDAIAPGTFKDCVELEKFEARATTNNTDASQLAKIGSEAFSGCTKLTNLNLGANITNFGDKVINNTSSLESLLISTITPPQVTENTFNNDNFDRTKLTVNVSAFTTYTATPIWELFNYDNDPTTDVADVASDEIRVTKTADGIRIDGAEEGTMISVITLDGKMVKSAVATGGNVELNGIEPTFHIVRIGDKVKKITF